MKQPPPPSLTPAERRRRAEDMLRAREAADPRAHAADTARLRLELQVHQIELEMQNEELLAARSDLETSLANYADLYDFAPVGYLTIDRDGVILAANLAGAALLKIDRARIGRRHFAFFVAEADRVEFRQWLDRSVAADTRESCELTLAPQAGPPVVVRLDATRTDDRAACRIALTDITERKRTEVALRENEAQLRMALDAARMGTFDWDVPGNRIVWSRGHEALWGFQPGEFDGTYEGFASRVHPDDLPGINAEVERCVAARDRWSREFRVVWIDGSVHWVAGEGEFTFDPDGRALRMRGVVMEVTARKQAEAESRLLQRLSLGVGAAQDLNQAMTLVLQEICYLTGWAMGEAWRPDAKRCRIELYRVWHRAAPGLEAFAQAGRAFTFKPGEGLPGRVWQTRQPEWLAALDDATRFPRHLIAAQAGLGAGLCVPVLAGDQVVLVLTFFLFESTPEDARRVALIAAVAAQIGSLVERLQANEELRERNNELERFNRAMVGRELRMIELKSDIDALRRRLGEPPLYEEPPLGDGER